MKNKFIIFTVAFLLASSVSAFAAHGSKGTHKSSTVSSKGVKKHHKNYRGKKAKKSRYAAPKVSATKEDMSSISYRTHIFEQQLHTLQAQIDQLKKQQAMLPLKRKESMLNGVFAHGPSVVTSPYFGGKPNYSGFDLLINLPNINEDASLLKVRQQVENYYERNNLDELQRPVLVLSGELEGQAWARSEFTDNYHDDLDLTTAELEVVGEVSKWITGVMVFEYDHQTTYTINRLGNSTVDVDRGYITVGNLNKSPVYFSIGQMYVPFGVYSYNSISDPVTLDLAKTKARAALLGFTANNGFYGAAYAFQGDTYTPNYRRNWGANLGYVHHNADDSFTIDLGGGYIYNIADSEGMQITSGNNYKDFGVFGGYSVDRGSKITSSVNLQDNYQAFDAHGAVTYKDLHLIAEYIGTIDRFNMMDLSYNNSGAKPNALDVEATLNFDLWRWHKPSYFAVGYDHSWEALGLNLPEQSYFAVLGTSLWKSTVQSIEYRHDINYDSKDRASGNMGQIIRGGSARNLWTANFRVFF